MAHDLLGNDNFCHGFLPPHTFRLGVGFLNLALGLKSEKAKPPPPGVHAPGRLLAKSVSETRVQAVLLSLAHEGLSATWP